MADKSKAPPASVELMWPGVRTKVTLAASSVVDGKPVIEMFMAEVEPLTETWELGPLASPPIECREMIVGPYLSVPTPDVDAWGRRGDREDDGPPEHVSESAVIIDDVVARSGPLGRAGTAELRRRVSAALLWARKNYEPSKGSFTVFGRSLASLAVRRMEEDIGWSWLRLELADENGRASARRGDAPLAAYLNWVKEGLTKLERSRRRGGDPDAIEALVSDTVLEVLALLRSENSAAFDRFERPGRPAYLRVVEHVRARHRREGRMHLVEAVVPVIDVPSPSPTPEQILLGFEAEPEAAAWVGRVNALATKKQRAWLAAFQAAAVDGHARGLCARAARIMGVHRSQAGRALAKLTELFRQAAPEGDADRLPARRDPGPASEPASAPTPPQDVEDLHIVLKRQSQANRRRRFAHAVRLAAAATPPHPATVAIVPAEELAAVLKQTSRLNRRRKFQRPGDARHAGR